jgi:hypothetical protein
MNLSAVNTWNDERGFRATIARPLDVDVRVFLDSETGQTVVQVDDLHSRDDSALRVMVDGRIVVNRS